MSYILDALRKSEKERQRGKVPDLLTVQVPDTPRPGKSPVLLYLLLIALLLNAGILVAWLRPWQSEEQSPVVRSTGSHRIQTPARRSGEEKTPDVALSDSKPVASEVKTVNPDEKMANKVPAPESGQGSPNVRLSTADPSGQQARTAKPAGSARDEESAPEGGYKEAQHEISSSTAEQAEITDDKPARSQLGTNRTDARQQKVFRINELPQSLRQSLPDMTQVAHIYSDEPASRKFIVKGRVLHEGEALTDEVYLKEITPAGVIFTYKGKSYHVRLF